MMQLAKNFQGSRVLSLENRRSTEIARLIETYGGVAISAPAIQEVAFSSADDMAQFAHDLIGGCYDLMVFLTGTGARRLLEAVSSSVPTDDFLRGLRSVKVAVRGPKPQAVMREWSVPVAMVAPEPCTWRELLGVLEQAPGSLLGKRIAVQEYGVPNPEFLDALRERGASVRAVGVYRWAFPDDLEPLRRAIAAVIEGSMDVVLFTTRVQVVHLFRIATEMGNSEALPNALNRMLVASIGPSTSAALRELGVHVDLEPTHPKMGVLVKEAAEKFAAILPHKHSNRPGTSSA